MAALPAATYRLQLNAAFTLDAAATVADYLKDLGITHVYCSPILQAVPGSQHGYDVVDPTRISDDLGGMPAFDRFAAVLRQNGLKLLLDIVPNHMATSPENAWWWDLLEEGPASQYAKYFDIDPDASGDGRILLPVLGDHLGRLLDAGEIKLNRAGQRLVIRYGEQIFPLSRQSRLELLKQTSEPDVDRGLAAVLKQWNSSPQMLDGLLVQQHYRLAHWRMAGEELGYRRFFDINSLIGLRIEDEAVFAASHALILRLAREGRVDGLRVDHPDGLRDPEGYLQRLRAAAPDAWILLEKILEPGEDLPQSWPVHGTTGYDFLNRMGGLFVDSGAEAMLTRAYQEFTGHPETYAQVARASKLQVLRDVLGSDVNRLAELLQRICERYSRQRDHTTRQLEDCLRELVASFPVYRTYVRAEPHRVREEDKGYVDTAISECRRHRPDMDAELLAFIGDLLLLRCEGPAETDFAMRFQQLTGPAMAKGVEDTAFYRYNRLASQNEVGSDPGSFGVSVEAFHRCCEHLQRDWPRTMLATSTHDTKRSEDVRARISLLSEQPQAWAAAIRRWSSMNEPHHRDGAPDRNMEYLLYETLVGAWPIDATRLTAYMQKAAREAKEHTSWLNPNAGYESGLSAFVEGILSDGDFVRELEAFVAPLVGPGRINSLAQTLLKLNAPGEPDTYQGMEIWNLSLVDPDNRRPVDYALLRGLLVSLDGLTPEQILDRADEGLPKLWITRQALRLRRNVPEAFGPDAAYRPLAASGAKAKHVVAFARGERVITLVPRLVLGLSKSWADTEISIPEGRWRSMLSGETRDGGPARVAQLAARFPVVLLSREVNA